MKLYGKSGEVRWAANGGNVESIYILEHYDMDTRCSPVAFFKNHLDAYRLLVFLLEQGVDGVSVTHEYVYTEPKFVFDREEHE